MKTRFLGRTGVKVSELCFGAMTFGNRGGTQRYGGLDQREADVLVGMCLEAGVNFFDTADVYASGLSEEILGKALAPRRKNVIITTKVRNAMGPGPNDVGLSRLHVIDACDASLRRLGTDYIDLYLLHAMDPNTPLEETLRALDELVRQGKVRYVGCCNFTGWHLMKTLAISDRYGWERLSVLQAHYSLMARETENELVPLCLDQGLGLMCWSPLEAGFLTGRFRRGQPRPEGSRITNRQDSFLRTDEEKGYDIVDELDVIARARGASVAQTALNYLLSKRGVISVIVGARNPEQLADNLKTTTWELTPQEIARLDEVSKPPRLYPYWMYAEVWRDRS